MTALTLPILNLPDCNRQQFVHGSADLMVRLLYLFRVEIGANFAKHVFIPRLGKICYDLTACSAVPWL
jgi:hypothetical protein